MAKRKDMKEIKVTPEELDEYPVADLMGKCVYTLYKHGIDKMKKIPQILRV
ncbi:MAG: hypothetical protein P8Y97_23120 [Candidatus Lokiarchaeota archaeon]